MSHLPPLDPSSREHYCTCCIKELCTLICQHDTHTTTTSPLVSMLPTSCTLTPTFRAKRSTRYRLQSRHGRVRDEPRTPPTMPPPMVLQFDYGSECACHRDRHDHARRPRMGQGPAPGGDAASIDGRSYGRLAQMGSEKVRGRSQSPATDYDQAHDEGRMDRLDQPDRSGDAPRGDYELAARCPRIPVNIPSLCPSMLPGADFPIDAQSEAAQSHALLEVHIDVDPREAAR